MHKEKHAWIRALSPFQGREDGREPALETYETARPRLHRCTAYRRSALLEVNGFDKSFDPATWRRGLSIVFARQAGSSLRSPRTRTSSFRGPSSLFPLVHTAREHDAEKATDLPLVSRTGAALQRTRAPGRPHHPDYNTLTTLKLRLRASQAHDLARERRGIVVANGCTDGPRTTSFLVLPSRLSLPEASLHQATNEGSRSRGEFLILFNTTRPPRSGRTMALEASRALRGKTEWNTGPSSSTTTTDASTSLLLCVKRNVLERAAGSWTRSSRGGREDIDLCCGAAKATSSGSAKEELGFSAHNTGEFLNRQKTHRVRGHQRSKRWYDKRNGLRT